MTSFALTLRRPSTLVLSAAALLLTACATAPTTPITPVLPARAGISGIVHGGQQAVSGATIQLWAVGTTGDASPATPLLPPPGVTTDANGNFNITGLYTCPSASSLVYLTGTGGNPGLTAGTNNPALAMMAALGTCGSLGASTYVTMNEVTTVGSVFALAPFMSSLSNIGYGSDLSAMTSAFNQINEFVNTATGAPGGPALPSGYGVSATQVNTLADLLATCINTNGGTSGDKSACGKLFALTGGSSTTDAIAAALYIANNPTASLTDLSNLIPPISPFQPLLSAPPSSWTITVQLIASTSGSGTITTVAGDGTYGYNGDAVQATSAELANAVGVALDSSGNLYIADEENNRIRMVTPAGLISTIAGNGTQGFLGNGGQAINAELALPAGVAVDSSGNLYIADAGNYRIRKVTPGGAITIYAGNGTEGYSGDGGQAVYAELRTPNGIAVDSSGNLYIADIYSHVIRMVTPAGMISTVAGNGTAGFSGDTGQAINAELKYPRAVAVDSSGNLYIADTGNDRIRMVTPAGVISTVAGNGTAIYNGASIQATSAGLSGPEGVAVDSSGNLYIADTGEQAVIKVTSAGVISYFAGAPGYPGYNGDGIQASGAELDSPEAVAVDSSGNLYIADTSNHRIRKVAH